ncbi:hypothetical protein [Burkholderia sp. S-53]|uniref:hypothetical protein n=1 Tax=Burkholderia sp. S-53 TaxID=2906514 RepID=UPI0021D012F6|nr:hypothetical protein [Burkholderia sp. S-53]UXU91145.1 hypothetical protein LXM88_23505 [Burkholderia sp. S-53]
MQQFARLRLYDCIGLSGCIVLFVCGLLMAFGWLVDSASLPSRAGGIALAALFFRVALIYGKRLTGRTSNKADSRH